MVLRAYNYHKKNQNSQERLKGNKIERKIQKTKKKKDKYTAITRGFKRNIRVKSIH